MILPFSYSRRLGHHGFALVVTLIMVTLAAILAVALLTSASLDRTTAKAYNDRFEAEMAARNGLEAAKKALVASPSAGAASVSADDTFLVIRADGNQGRVGNKDAYYFLAKAQPGNANRVDCYPLFSGGTSSQVTINLTQTPTFQTPAVPTSAMPAAAQETFGTTVKQYPQLLPFQQSAYTAWQEVRDPSDTAVPPAHNLPYQRYTFWVEDLSGYLDASVVGNAFGTGSVHQRANGMSPSEIALFTLFDPAPPTDSGTTLAKNLLDNRAILLTAPTLKQVAPPTGQNEVTQPNLAVRLGIDTGGERNLIPFGFGFQDESKAKTNLNTLIADASKTDDQKITVLFKAMNENLPLFASMRKGGLAASEDYAKTLTANMISYATGEPVVGAGYRGIGLHPFVVEFYEQFIWARNGPGNYYVRNGTYWVDVKAAGYVQLWNMANKPITSGTLDFVDINRYYAYVGGQSTEHKFDEAFGTGSIVFSASSPLASNEFKVFKIYDHLYSFDSGVAFNPVNPPTGTLWNSVKLNGEGGVTVKNTDSAYLTKWNGKIIERAGAGTLDGARGDGSDRYPNLNYRGLERGLASLKSPTSASDPSWPGTLPGLRYSLTGAFGESIYNLGDPRSAYYIQEIQSNVSYNVQSAWWGRIYQNGLVNQASPWKAAETTVASWPDGGHSTLKGLLPPNTATDPISLTGTRPPIEAKAPVSIAGTGSYASVTELSRVYDPIQWKPAGFPPSSRADFEAKWKNAWKSSMISDPNYGCASTLHIGSPEFKNFDTKDGRASRLLDLFAVTDRSETRGLINLNTASREALRALGAGLELKQDPAIIPASVFGPVNDPATPVQADKFADAVIANRPFLSSSQLSDMVTISGDPTSKFFGSSTQWISAGPTEWNDSAREEYFSRMLNLTTVRSRNFRVFATGQSLDKTGKVLSTVNRAFQVYLRPTRNAAGKISNQQAEITYEKDL